MNIPLVDLRAQYLQIKDEIDSAVQRVIESSSFVGGKEVKEFEESFAAFCGAKHCIGVGNGTDALSIALRCSGVGSGDEVVTVPNTFVATAEAISSVGARPVFVDIDEKSYTMDTERLWDLMKRREKNGNRRIRAVIPVHLYGQPCSMDPILEIAREHRLIVIEDAAQAHAAQWFGSEKEREPVNSPGKRIGSMGNAGCFSFYPGKNLGAYGDGGAILTNDDALARKIRRFADHGRIGKYDHEFVGINSRLDGLQAAILGVKLRHLEEWTEKRRRNASIYKDFLQDLAEDKVLLPFESAFSRHVFHLFVVRVKSRERVRNLLSQNGISTGIHYPIPLHLTKAYADLGYKRGDFPLTERCSDEILSLPMYPELSSEEISFVADCLAQVQHVGR